MGTYTIDLLGVLLLGVGGALIGAGMMGLIGASYYRQRWEQWRGDND